MQQHLKRLFSSTILFTGLMVCLTDQNACEVTAKSTNSIQTTKSKDNVVEIKIPAVAGVTINNARTVSIEKNDTNMVTSSVNTEEDVEPSREDLIESHNDRWQEVRFDYASMDDTYYDMTYPLAKIIYAEGGGQSDMCQQYIGYVVINRIESKYYPNTLKRVFFSGGYAPESQEKYRNGECSDRAIENAKIVINNYYNDTMPVSPALVYQSKFSQGINQFQIDGEEFGYSQRILRDLEQ